jgi:signal transduction histidine kinase
MCFLGVRDIDGSPYIHALPYAAYVLLTKSLVTEVSYPFADMTGYSREELLKKPVQDICRLLFKSSEPYGDLLSFGDTKQFFVFTRTNQVRAVEVTRTRGLTCDEIYLVFREKANSRLEDRFPYLEQVICANHEGVGVFSAREIILLKANQCYLDFLDEPYSNMEHSIGHPLREIMTGWGGSEMELFFKKALDKGEPICAEEFVYSSPERGHRYWNIMITPIEEDCDFKYIVCSITDVTKTVLERKAAEEQWAEIIRKKDEIESALRVKDEFFSFISHEFKTPLTMINAAVQTMELICREEMSAKLKKFITQIRQNSFRMLRLVNNLLDITRVENGYIKINKANLDIVMVTKAITESVMLYAREKGVALLFESDFPSRIAAIDEEKYERIILNLLSNAIKFTPPGKSIKVRVSEKEEKICIEVADEGIGIPEEKQSIIFDRFSRVDSGFIRNSEGTGIGLCLTKLLVEAFGGTISVRSEKDKGSTFTVLLPSEEASREVVAERTEKFLDTRSVQAVDIEFSDIYLEG